MFDLRQIIGWLNKNFPLKDRKIILLLLLSFFIMRLINLDSHPIFVDEGIYINWAKIARADPVWRFISLTDGRQPLQTWGIIPFLKILPENSLLAGRLFSVFTGLAALIGIFSLTFYLWGKKASYFAAIFYILTPFFLFYDRLSLIDSGVNAAFIWLLFFSILLARTGRLDVALIYGLATGAALLAKSSTQIFFILGLFSLTLFFQKKSKTFPKRLINFLILYGISAVIAFSIYSIQRLSPFFTFVAEKNKTFVMTVSEFLRTPFAYFFQNIIAIPKFAVWESAFVLPIIGIVGFYTLKNKDRKLFYYFILFILFSFLIISFFAKILFPRYLIFFASFFAILASLFVSSIKNKQAVKILIGIYLLSILYFNFTILFDFKNIPFPPIDRGQYIEGVSAGWGIKEAISEARKRSTNAPLLILAEGDFGISADMLKASLKKSDKIEVKGYWPLEKKNLLEHQKDLEGRPVLVFFSYNQSPSPDWPVKIIAKYEKPGGKSYFSLYELTK